MANHTPILDLRTVFEPRFIRIDGQMHELLQPGALTLERSVQIADLHRHYLERMALIKTQGRETPDDARAVASLLRDMVAVVLVAPPAVIEQLTDPQCLAVCQAFSQLPPSTPATTGAARQPDHPLTGPTSSRGSSGSTAQMRTRGGREHRSRSSKRA